MGAGVALEAKRRYPQLELHIGDYFERHGTELRNPLADELAGGVVVARLLSRVIGERVAHIRGPGMNLHLVPVNGRVVIEELTCQMQSHLPRRQPELIERKGDDGAAQAHVEPARLRQHAHRGVHIRHAGLSGLPGR